MWKGDALRLPIHVVLLALLVGSLAACSVGTSNPAINSVVDLRVSGTAQGWTGGAAVLRVFGTNREDVEFISQGSIADNGDFTLELPEPLSMHESFGPLTCEVGEIGELEVTPSTMRVSLVRGFRVTKRPDLDDSGMGEVVHIKGDQAGNEDFTLGTYAYASAPGTVRGTCIGDYGTSTHTFNLTLAEGWNHVVVAFANLTTDFVATYRTVAPPPDLRCVYYEFPPPPHEGPPPPSEPDTSN